MAGVNRHTPANPKLFQRLFIHHQSQMECSGIESRSTMRSQWPTSWAMARPISDRI